MNACFAELAVFYVHRDAGLPVLSKPAALDREPWPKKKSQPLSIPRWQHWKKPDPSLRPWTKRLLSPKAEDASERGKVGGPASNLHTLLRALLGVVDNFGCLVLPMHESYTEKIHELLGLSFVQRMGYGRKMQEFTLALRQAIRNSFPKA